MLRGSFSIFFELFLFFVCSTRKNFLNVFSFFIKVYTAFYFQTVGFDCLDVSGRQLISVVCSRSIFTPNVFSLPRFQKDLTHSLTEIAKTGIAYQAPRTSLLCDCVLITVTSDASALCRPVYG